MGRKFTYSAAEWEVYARGESAAEAQRPLKIPLGLNTFEQTAFREGYLTRCEDIKNRPVVAEIKKMVLPLPIKSLFICLVRRQ
jgi:hypothetical protein